MQPIPLDLDSLVIEPAGWGWVALILGVLVFLGGLFCLSRKEENAFLVFGGIMAFTAGTLGMLIGLIGLTAGNIPDDKAQAKAIDDRNDLITTQIEAAYGLQLTEGEVNDLEYPTAAPGEDFQVFGSIVRNEQLQDADFSKQTIYLVWANDQLQLSQSADGENFEQLDRKN